MLSLFKFAIFIFVFIASYFGTANSPSNKILVTKTMSPVNETAVMVNFLFFIGNNEKSFLTFKRYVGDICQKKNENDELYKALNSYHQILKLNLELDPTNFLDA